MSSKTPSSTDLKVVLALVMLTSIFVLLPPFSDSHIRIILGIPMVLFLPGYALIAALFPGKEDLDGIERVALSFGLSIAVVPLLGLILNYTPWGIRLIPAFSVLYFFTVAMSLIGIHRREALGDQAFEIPFRKMYESLKAEITTKPESRIDRILTVILVVMILISVVTLVYVVVTPKQGERFTEFYILGPEGMADGYDTKLLPGESVNVIVGVVNHEYELVNYSLGFRLDNGPLQISNNISLAHNETWEHPVSFEPEVTGSNMKLRYLLYREGNFTEPYRDLHLWINVTDN